MAEDNATIKVCVGNYGSYTAGYLIDEWFELPMVPQELDKRLSEMRAKAEKLTGSPCEEFYISDYDGYPLDVADKKVHDMFTEHTPIESLNLMAAQLTAMDDYEIEAASAYLGQQGSSLGMDEAMNVLLQANEVPYYGYDWQPYTGTDAVWLAISDSRTVEFKYGVTCIENNPKLKALLDSDSCIDSAFDYEEYGRICAEGDDVTLFDDGYLVNESIDMAHYDHDQIFEEVLENLARFDDPALYDGFEKLWGERQHAKTFRELASGHTLYQNEPPQSTAPDLVSETPEQPKAARPMPDKSAPQPNKSAPGPKSAKPASPLADAKAASTQAQARSKTQPQVPAVNVPKAVG